MYVLLLMGLGFLVAGGELFVRASSRLALVLGVSPLIIGLTVVSMGTSAPELAVSVFSALSRQPDVAVGNVVGSNIFNILFILGITSLIAPLVVSQRLVQWDVPLMIGVSGLAYVFAWDGQIRRWEGAIFILGLVSYIVFAIKTSGLESSAVKQEYEAEFQSKGTSSTRSLLRPLFLIVIGMGALILGSHWFVQGAVQVARQWGVSELIIGLTIVAAGTSLPEVFTSIVAARRGEVDIAVGNVVGSNIFNILGILGVASSISSTGINVAPTALAFDFPVMLAVAVACLPVFFTGHKISRWEGGVFLFCYVAYLGFLIS